MPRRPVAHFALEDLEDDYLAWLFDFTERMRGADPPIGLTLREAFLAGRNTGYKDYRELTLARYDEIMAKLGR